MLENCDTDMYINNNDLKIGIFIMLKNFPCKTGNMVLQKFG